MKILAGYNIAFVVPKRKSSVITERSEVVRSTTNESVEKSPIYEIMQVLIRNIDTSVFKINILRARLRVG